MFICVLFLFEVNRSKLSVYFVSVGAISLVLSCDAFSMQLICLLTWPPENEVNFLLFFFGRAILCDVILNYTKARSVFMMNGRPVLKFREPVSLLL